MSKPTPTADPHPLPSGGGSYTVEAGKLVPAPADTPDRAKARPVNAPVKPASKEA